MNLETTTKRTFFETVRSKFSSLALLMALGCQDSATTSCNIDVDCPGTELCVENYCASDEACVVDNDCPGDLICDDSVCVPQSSPSNVKTANVGGIPINSGFTDAQGEIVFWDSQSKESVQTYAKDGNGNPLINAGIIFEDGDGFETFHGDFQGEPYFHIFAHNSEKLLNFGYLKDLAVKTFEYTKNLNENSYVAAKKYAQHSRKIGKEVGCVLPKDIYLAQDQRITAIIDLTDLIPKVGGKAKKYLTYTKRTIIDTPYNVYNDLVERGIIAPDDCKAFQTWETIETFKRQAINVLAASELRNYKCLTQIPPEICSDGIDNDCDGLIDKNDSDCKTNSNCKDECTSSGTYCASSSKVEICGNFDNDPCLEKKSQYCNSNESCSGGVCVEDKVTPNCKDECSYNGQKVCTSSTTTKICGDFDSDDCLEWKFESCDSNESCSGGVCVEDKVTPTCSDECSYNGKIICESSTKKKICGDYDSDKCLEWKVESCNSNEICQTDSCNYVPTKKTILSENFNNLSDWDIESNTPNGYIYTSGGVLNLKGYNSTTGFFVATKKPIECKDEWEIKLRVKINQEATFGISPLFDDPKLKLSSAGGSWTGKKMGGAWKGYTSSGQWMNVVINETGVDINGKSPPFSFSGSSYNQNYILLRCFGKKGLCEVDDLNVTCKN